MDQKKRVKWKPGTLVYPVPALMVSCGTMEKHNIITIAWTGTINTNPPMCYISVRPERYSYSLIKESGQFVINLCTKELTRATDWCGVKSGRDYDKFKEMNLTPTESTEISAPGIGESPMQLECRVTEVKELGSHHMFLAEVVAVTVDPAYLDERTNSFAMERTGLMAFAHGKYYGLTQPLGKFGYSIQKKKPRRKKK